MEQQPFWDKQETVGEIMRGKYNTIVVSRCEKNGNKYVDIRNWYIPLPAVKEVVKYIEEVMSE
ncbi:hypothetical protein [Alicyclobacillus sendaiensis]|uniref:hypothetical protein n=1 Tax=Alicyclobacillus sendaiensis TaxID=192387 RepID=UPI0026F4320F|nr:hypothetical protein [Alicyclobacillus sendaiensis]